MQAYSTGMALLVSSLLALSNLTATAAETFTAHDGQPLKIKPEHFDSEQAKKFQSSGQNPYLGDKTAIEQGKKLYQLYSCTQCHGSQAQGQTAVGLTGPKYNNAKSATDKGMFEVIWGGTNAGMGPKGKGLMDPTNPNNGMSADEVLKVIAWIRSQGEGAAK